MKVQQNGFCPGEKLVLVNELKLFENQDFGQIRTTAIDGEAWFVAADVCKALDIQNITQALDRLDEDERAMLNIGRQGCTNIVNEPGLYSLVLGSRKPEAKAFKRWVTHEVIPAIRKHGIYATDATIDHMISDPDFGIQLLTQLKSERDKRIELENTIALQNQQIAELSPKAGYYDLILQTRDTVSISKIAKDYGKSAIWMNRKLSELGVQYMQGRMWLLYQKYAQQGYTQSKTVPIVHKDGMPGSAMSTYWTQKGRLFLYELLKRNGILPLIELKEQAT